ncbi:putative parvulin-type peptidyl-prolyl cis-trans isomerase precursor [Pigmentiphaga humi]|uniref:peptidylprolyl isomerase n=1 Tax=Pigmentiphaga humi TaxID=2478468 RepID=A0A3P4B905_9BURK|nr:peptidylprolyl isomerase [Pigmentiphaga humi]VCU71996.1 putative parvulin-type peptidyl-prolyl cis-trans isomerase precursor [Pigmentiphaga humi]
MKRVLMLAAALTVAAPVFAQNAAVVNGKAIPSSRVDQFVKLLVKQGQPDSPQLREQIRDELINREIFLQEADKRGVARQPEIQAEIELTRQTVVIRGLFNDFIAKNPITDQQVQAEYDRVKAAQGGQEYLARHILVESEDQAKDIIAQLKKGAKFEDLAKQSKDPGSAANGGSLDWAPSSTYVKPFADALGALQKGQMTEAPVQTQFGWHVIRLDDVRPVEFPPVDQLRPQIEESLRQNKLREFQSSLREKAKIQ